ncbi:small lysine-rich protein 1 [Chiloscyllium punctatum]|uniref:Small lysine-rich protein 1 n=1 Tax=Chiloscyllium punctatum TaxID=137246 RepID=A0A401SI74_CHIPU|nr:hypothetical protein [Chiloscyllium punctatum]
MPSKSKKGKGKAHSAKAKKEKGSKKKKKKDKKDKGSKSETEVDIMSPAAMYNLYYISHNAADSLIFRGFPWSGGQRKKGRK